MLALVRTGDTRRIGTPHSGSGGRRSQNPQPSNPPPPRRLPSRLLERQKGPLRGARRNPNTTPFAENAPCTSDSNTARREATNREPSVWRARFLRISSSASLGWSLSHLRGGVSRSKRMKISSNPGLRRASIIAHRCTSGREPVASQSAHSSPSSSLARVSYRSTSSALNTSCQRPFTPL